MIATAITLILSNLPIVFCLAAILIPTLFKGSKPWPQRYLSWILLLAVGLDGVWAGFFHVFFPDLASAQIGWQPSPYEFEVGIGDIALGIVAIAAFWRSLAFQSAIALYAILFYAGVSVGHVVQAIADSDFAPNNFGVLLVLTVARVVVLLWLLWAANSRSLDRVLKPSLA